MLDFISKHKTLPEVLMDQKLAALGDAYVNLLFSLALSKKRGEPVGARVNNNLLAVALRKAGLRELLPSRTNRHERANAAEALIVYAWIRNAMTIKEAISILEREEDLTEGFCALILVAKEKLNL
ncbi:MAG: ribonuclease III family protein [Candidatus Bathyarchaeia archaeon]